MSETLLAPARFELEVKKSRFLVHAAPIASADAAFAYLEQVAARDATHNCWAFRLGATYRFSDDGEPAGTAGKPMLAAIDAQKLDGVMAVVTRWYGGIKLGAGGLARAYGGSVAECLRRAERRRVIDYLALRVRLDFEHAAALHTLLTQFDGHKLDESYDADGLQARLRLPAEHEAAFAAALRDATRGRATLLRQ